MAHSLVRVQVVGHGRRLDVCLPARVPVWEFLPEVSRGLGGDGVAAAGLVTATGELLDAGADLQGQGVRHGDVLTVAPPAEHQPPVLHDDLVRAVHDRARVVLPGWGPEAARTTALVVATAAPTVALGLLLTVPGAQASTLALAGLCALVLLALGQVAERRAAPAWCRVLVGWLGVTCAGVAGSALAPTAGAWGPYVPLAAAGGVGLVLVVTAGSLWPLHVPPVLVSTTSAASGLAAEVARVPPWEALLALVATGTLVASLLPAAVVELTVARGQDASEGVDLERLDADLVLAHRLVLAGSLTGTLLTLAVVPAAASAGVAPTAVVLLLVALRLLRVRHQRSRAVCLAGVVGAGACVLAVVLAVASARPELVPWVVGALVLLAATVTLGALGEVRSPRRAWCADLVEVAVVVSLPVVTTVTLWWPRVWPSGGPGW